MTVWKRLGRRLRRIVTTRRFKKRYDVINYFVRARKALTYLEIGTSTGRCLDRVAVACKVGVDPSPKALSPAWTIEAMTSDAFFAENSQRFDVIFIDGLHLAEQVLRDLWNSAAVLSPGGALLLHDCNPKTAEAASREAFIAADGKWNGDTWKAIAYLRDRHPGVFCRVLDLDHGVGVVLPGGPDALAPLSPELEADAAEFFASIGWEDLVRNRRELLGLVKDRRELEREMRAAGIGRAAARRSRSLST